MVGKKIKGDARLLYDNDTGILWGRLTSKIKNRSLIHVAKISTDQRGHYGYPISLTLCGKNLGTKRFQVLGLEGDITCKTCLERFNKKRDNT